MTLLKHLSKMPPNFERWDENMRSRQRRRKDYEKRQGQYRRESQRQRKEQKKQSQESERQKVRRNLPAEWNLPLPYDHKRWWEKLPHVKRKKKTSAIVKHKTDPLKCNDRFGEEISEEESENALGQQSGKKQENGGIEPNTETKIDNLKALEVMARHLDILSVEGEEGSALALSACLPLPTQVETVRMWDESGSGREAQDDLLQSGLVARKEVVVERKSNLAFSSQILRCWAGGQLVR